VLPRRIYGLDVTLEVGERHLREGVALAQITRDLNARGVPIDQRHTGRVFRDYVTLAALARGDDETLVARLRSRGGIVLMCDGVQFDNRSPVLYVVWDAISGEPLFGERKLYRGEDDLVPLLKRVQAMDVPVIGAVTDKETGLVPAVQRVFPDVPYQFCHTHFLKNCAKPMQEDLSALQASIRRRADKAREVGKRESSSLVASPPEARTDDVGPTAKQPATTPSSEVVMEPGADLADASPSLSSGGEPSADAEPPPAATPTGQLTEHDFVLEVCELARVNSRISGKAPLDPPELKRHERLEDIRALVNEARKKNSRAPQNPRTGACSTN